MKLIDFIAEYKPVLVEHIRKYIEERKNEHSDVSFFSDSLDRLYPFTTSGKMLRGLFILLIYSFFTKLEPNSKVINAAAAMELIQSALLIHDDIIDNDRIRRGNKTIFAQYSDYGEKKKYHNFDLYGRNQGVCVGDISIFLAFDLLSSCSDDLRTLSRVSSLFAKENHLVVIGEMIDINMAADSKEPSVEKILEMYKYKTARYSFALPFEAGACLGNADDSTYSLLAKLGETTGILFQIQDDWLGIYGSEAEIGKPVGSDLRERKKTIYRALLFESLPYNKKNEIDSLPPEEILKLMEKYNTEQKVQEHKNIYEKESNDIISRLPFTSAQKKVLLDIVELITKRKK